MWVVSHGSGRGHVMACCSHDAEPVEPCSAVAPGLAGPCWIRAMMMQGNKKRFNVWNVLGILADNMRACGVTMNEDVTGSGYVQRMGLQ